MDLADSVGKNHQTYVPRKSLILPLVNNNAWVFKNKKSERKHHGRSVTAHKPFGRLGPSPEAQEGWSFHQDPTEAHEDPSRSLKNEGFIRLNGISEFTIGQLGC